MSSFHGTLLLSVKQIGFIQPLLAARPLRHSGKGHPCTERQTGAGTPMFRSVAGSLTFLGAAAAGLRALRLLLVRRGATCTSTPPSAVSGRLAGRRMFGTAGEGQAGTRQQTGKTKGGQGFLKLLWVHHGNPFQLVVYVLFSSKGTRNGSSLKGSSS